MFDNLSNRLSRMLRDISGKGRLSEDNIKETLREVRKALLEADVALPVVRDFITRVKNRALGQKINKSLTPGQEFVKIVYAELVHAMGDANKTLNLSVKLPAVVLVTGLKGVGKTTSIGKLSKYLREKKKKKVLVVSADIYRPAAIKQLEILANAAGVDFFPSRTTEKPLDIVNKALKQAKVKFYDVLLIDTAGCLNIDTITMAEIITIHATIHPVETLFVVDAMTGQDAANTAKAFSKALPLTGVILTKVDSDARGGGALSIRYLTGIPIKFMGIGEDTCALEIFYPDRLAKRILGMDDILSLIEDIESKIDFSHTGFVKNLKKVNNFDLTDFLDQIRQMRNISKTSGLNQFLSSVKFQIEEKNLMRMEAIINSMTTKERASPDIINGSRKRRIAAGSGLQVQDVNRLLKQFNDMQYIMKKIKKGGISKIVRSIKEMKLPSFLNR